MNLDKLSKNWDEYFQLFFYNYKYYNAREIVKLTKLSWPQTSQTKYDKFRDPSKWAEIERLYGIEVVLGAALGKNHLITTKGSVLLAGSLKETCRNGLSVVSYTDNGKNFNSIYRANLVMNKFVDNEFDILNDRVYYIDKNMNNCDIDNIQHLDSSLRTRGRVMNHNKKAAKVAAENDSYCY